MSINQILTIQEQDRITTNDLLNTIATHVREFAPMYLKDGRLPLLEDSYGTRFYDNPWALLVGSRGPKNNKSQQSGIAKPRFYLAPGKEYDRSRFGSGITEIRAAEQGFDFSDTGLVKPWTVEKVITHQAGVVLRSIPEFSLKQVELIMEDPVSTEAHIFVVPPLKQAGDKANFGKTVNARLPSFGRNEPTIVTRIKDQDLEKNAAKIMEQRYGKEFALKLAQCGGLDLQKEFVNIAQFLPVKDNPELLKALDLRAETMAGLDDLQIRQEYFARLRSLGTETERPKFIGHYEEMLEADNKYSAAQYGDIIDRILSNRVYRQFEQIRHFPDDKETREFAIQLIIKGSQAEALMSMEGLAVSAFCNACLEKLDLSHRPLHDHMSAILNTTFEDIYGGETAPVLQDILNNLAELAHPLEAYRVDAASTLPLAKTLRMISVNYLRARGILDYNYDGDWKSHLGTSHGKYEINRSWALEPRAISLSRLAISAAYQGPEAQRILEETLKEGTELNISYLQTLNGTRDKDYQKYLARAYTQMQLVMDTLEYIQAYLRH